MYQVWKSIQSRYAGKWGGGLGVPSGESAPSEETKGSYFDPASDARYYDAPLSAVTEASPTAPSAASPAYGGGASTGGPASRLDEALDAIPPLELEQTINAYAPNSAAGAAFSNFELALGQIPPKLVEDTNDQVGIQMGSVAAAYGDDTETDATSNVVFEDFDGVTIGIGVATATASAEDDDIALAAAETSAAYTGFDIVFELVWDGSSGYLGDQMTETSERLVVGIDFDDFDFEIPFIFSDSHEYQIAPDTVVVDGATSGVGAYGEASDGRSVDTVTDALAILEDDTAFSSAFSAAEIA